MSRVSGDCNVDCTDTADTTKCGGSAAYNTPDAILQVKEAPVQIEGLDIVHDSKFQIVNSYVMIQGGDHYSWVS